MDRLATSALSIVLTALVTIAPGALDARERSGNPIEKGIEGHEVARAGDGLFYVQARVNGQPVRFLVDSGASVVTLTPGDAARLGVAPARGRYTSEVRTASGRAPMAWTRIGSVEIAGQELTGLRAAVVRNGLNVSLLGQNALAQLDSVTFEGDLLRLR